MPNIQELPIDLLLDHLLPCLSLTELAHMSSTNRFFADLTNDDVFWRRKLLSDFNFDASKTARTTGFKFIYRGLNRPRLFVWGERSQGRLGLKKYPRTSVGDVPFPVEFKIPGIRIVSITSAGMSFNALDDRGQMFVWGVINGQAWALQSDDYTNPGKRADSPMKLIMPAATRSVSCGRVHTSTLDSNDDIWTFLSWGHAFRLDSHLLDSSVPESVPIQVECGWSFTCVLTKSFDVLVWFPSDPALEMALTTRISEDADGTVTPDHDELVCKTSTLRHDPHRLPPLPNLPELLGNTYERIHLVKIAAMDMVIIGLTNQGHVLRCAEISVDGCHNAYWEYLPTFSEANRIRDHPTFQNGATKAPEVMHITHISAHFQTFIAYSTGATSIVLLGRKVFGVEDLPILIPNLQYADVISVVLGDWHFGALTASGNMVTWGGYSKGALGLGDPGQIPAGQPGGFATETQRLVAIDRGHGTPPDVTEPTTVKFGRKKKFCFAAAAAGWQTGALVIDLSDGESDQEEIEDQKIQNISLQDPTQRHREIPLPRPPFTTQQPAQSIGIPRPTLLPFRAGFARRGRGGSTS